MSLCVARGRRYVSLCGRDARGSILCHRGSRGSLAAAPRSLLWGPCMRPLFTSKTKRKRNAKKIEQAASSPEKADIILGSKYPRGTQRSKNLHSEAARLGVSQSGRANIPLAARVQNSVRFKAIIARHSRRPAPLPLLPLGRTTRQKWRGSSGADWAAGACESAHDPLERPLLGPPDFFF